MIDKNAFDRQLEREVEYLAGPEPRVDLATIVAQASRPRMRPRLAWLSGSLRFATATVAVAVFGLVLVFGWLDSGDRDVMIAPGASDSPSPAPSPSAGSAVPVTGTWVGPDAATCETTGEPTDEPWLSAVTVCPGLRFQTDDDQRMSAEGSIRHEEWADGGPPSDEWTLTNPGGVWESRRYHAHERLVLVGAEGYAGMTAVLTLAEDGSFAGFIQSRQPTEDPVE